MAQTEAQVWKSSCFTIERHDNGESGQVDFRMSGPMTMRDMYSCMSPEEFDRVFDFQPAGEEPRIQNIDLTHVPYMDSTGLGVLIRLYVRCHAKGLQFVVSGVSPRVLELFRMTRVAEILQPAHVL